MFLTGHVPTGQRAAWPVLESGGEVIWAQGMPTAEDFRARENTRTGVVIEEDALESDPRKLNTACGVLHLSELVAASTVFTVILVRLE